MMEGLPFFCVWGWEFTLSLEKEFEDANRVIEFCDETPRHLFQDIFKMARLAPCQLLMKFVHSLFCGAGRMLTVYSQWRRTLLNCFVWKYWKPGNIYLLEMALNCYVDFDCFGGLGITRILSRCWRKIGKTFIKMDTESWKLSSK